MNCVDDPILDRSSSRVASPSSPLVLIPCFWLLHVRLRSYPPLLRDEQNISELLWETLKAFIRGKIMLTDAVGQEEAIIDLEPITDE